MVPMDCVGKIMTLVLRSLPKCTDGRRTIINIRIVEKRDFMLTLENEVLQNSHTTKLIAIRFRSMTRTSL